jgi:hypothetical protein
VCSQSQKLRLLLLLEEGYGKITSSISMIVLIFFSRDMTPDQALAFEGNLMKTKMALEDAFASIAEATG